MLNYHLYLIVILVAANIADASTFENFATRIKSAFPSYKVPERSGALPNTEEYRHYPALYEKVEGYRTVLGRKIQDVEIHRSLSDNVLTVIKNPKSNEPIGEILLPTDKDYDKQLNEFNRIKKQAMEASKKDSEMKARQKKLYEKKKSAEMKKISFKTSKNDYETKKSAFEASEKDYQTKKRAFETSKNDYEEKKTSKEDYESKKAAFEASTKDYNIKTKKSAIKAWKKEYETKKKSGMKSKLVEKLGKKVYISTARYRDQGGNVFGLERTGNRATAQDRDKMTKNEKEDLISKTEYEELKAQVAEQNAQMAAYEKQAKAESLGQNANNGKEEQHSNFKMPLAETPMRIIKKPYIQSDKKPVSNTPQTDQSATNAENEVQNQGVKLPNVATPGSLKRSRAIRRPQRFAPRQQ